MSDPQLLRRLADLIDGGVPCATAQIVRATGSIPNEIGAMMIVGADGELLGGTVGGGVIEHQARSAASGAIRDGKSSVFTAKLTEKEAGGIGMRCGGSVDVYLQVHVPEPRLLLLGAGHINLCLARMSAGLGFRVLVVDDRAEWANADNYPNAEVVVARPEAAIPDLPIDRRTYVIVATRDRDHEAIVAAARTSACYIGVVASKRKAIQLTREVAREVDLDTLLPRFYAPIGLDLGGRTPEAVALSILSEVQAHRHGHPGGAMRIPPDKLSCYVRDA